MTTYCFSVHTERCPSALPRVLNAVALTGLIPHSLYTQSDLDGLAIDLQLDGLDASQAAKLAGRLGRVVAVTSVLFGEKRHARAA